MPKSSSPSPGSSDPSSSSALQARVRHRVTEAVATTERDAWKSAEDREARGLRRVFHQMGRSYRLHRRQTGDRVNPSVREAALAFKGEPSLAALTEVAARLEQEGIINW